MSDIRRSLALTALHTLVVLATLTLVAVLVIAGVMWYTASEPNRRAKATQTACMQNLMQLGKACEMYEIAWGDVRLPYGIPDAYSPEGMMMWPDLLLPYLKQIEDGDVSYTALGRRRFRCPAALEDDTGLAYQFSYGINTFCGGWMPGDSPVVVSITKAKYPSQTIRLAETEWEAQGGSLLAALPSEFVLDDPTCHRFATRHNDLGNVLWLDGHVSMMTRPRYCLTDGQPNPSVWLRLDGPKPDP